MTKRTFIEWLIFLMVALWILCLPVFCRAASPTWKFYIMGVDVSELRDASPGDYGKMALGAAASLATHIAGHYIAAEIFDVNITQVGFEEHFDRPNEWVSRGGFLFQLGINTLLVECDNSYFTKGFTAFTALELVTYPMRRPDHGDFYPLPNGDLEHFLYSTWAAHNLWRLK